MVSPTVRMSFSAQVQLSYYQRFERTLSNSEYTVTYILPHNANKFTTGHNQGT